MEGNAQWWNPETTPHPQEEPGVMGAVALSRTGSKATQRTPVSQNQKTRTPQNYPLLQLPNINFNIVRGPNFLMVACFF